jgi:hypothetical protein
MLSNFKKFIFRRVLFLAAFCLFVGGCGGPSQAKVSGHVTLGGKPLAEGLVTFRPTPKTEGPDFSSDVVNGDYRVAKGVLPGEYVVDVRSWQKTGKIVKTPQGDTTDEIVNAVPRRYWGESTVLTAGLKAGANTVNFDLQP